MCLFRLRKMAIAIREPYRIRCSFRSSRVGTYSLPKSRTHSRLSEDLAIVPLSTFDRILLIRRFERALR